MTTASLTLPDIELLRRFTKPGCEHFSEPWHSWNYRGDCTETGDQRLRASMGDEAYAHYHWDTLATTGRILIRIPRCKHPEAKGGEPGRLLTAPHWWAMSSAQKGGPEVVPLSKGLRGKISQSDLGLLETLPGLDLLMVKTVTFYRSSSRHPGRRYTVPPPRDVIYFRFEGGAGCVLRTDAEKFQKKNRG